MRSISLHSRRKLQPGDARHFVGLEPRLFAELATVTCSTGVLPQKELHECWQMAEQVHREFPNIMRIADIAAGHGLLAWILVLLARTSEPPVPRTAVAIDIKKPKSADILSAAITARWPDLINAVHYVESSVEAVTADERDDKTLFVATHACGNLSDLALLTAIASNNPVAIMPCCHSLRKQADTLASLATAAGLDTATISLQESPASIDHFRISALSALGYTVREGAIDVRISARNRIIMSHPPLASKRRTASIANHNAEAESEASKRGRGIRAFETVHSLNVNDIESVKHLSMRPSREWARSFDLSFWVDTDEVGEHFAVALKSLSDRMLPNDDPTVAVVIRDRYTEPNTLRRAFTFRIELSSTMSDINKDTVSALRKKICRSIKLLSVIWNIKTELRS